MMRMSLTIEHGCRAAVLSFLLLLAGIPFAVAQTVPPAAGLYCYDRADLQWHPCDSTNPLQTNTNAVVAGSVAQGAKGPDAAADSWYVQPGTGAVFAVTTSPVGATTTMTSGAITTQNTFQSVLASSGTRKGATLQNTSTSDILYVFFGANGSATKAGSFQINPGLMISASTGSGVVLTDNISATCADATPANCTFVVGAQ